MIRVRGEIELVENGKVILRKGNRITNRGVKLLAKALIDGRVVIDKVVLGTGTSPTDGEETGLYDPLPFEFPIINKYVEEVDTGRVKSVFVSMIETEYSASFSFSEAGLLGVDPDTRETILIARTTFPIKNKRPYNEYYFYWKIDLSIT